MACQVGQIDCQLAFDNAHKLAALCFLAVGTYIATRQLSANITKQDYEKERDDANAALSLYVDYHGIIASLEAAQTVDQPTYRFRLLQHADMMAFKRLKLGVGPKENAMIDHLFADFDKRSETWPIAEWRSYQKKTPVSIRYLKMFIYKRREVIEQIERRVKETLLLEQHPAMVYQLSRRRKRLRHHY
jgi:hypothetical protein